MSGRGSRSACFLANVQNFTPYNSSKSKHKKKSLNKRREYLSEKLKRLEALANKNTNYINRLDNQIEYLEERIRYTRDKAKQQRIQLWIKEKEDKIISIANFNAILLGKIDEVKKKLNSELIISRKTTKK